MSDLTGDGGVLKETTVEGTGAVPQQGQRVWAHYTGKLTDGTQFDSSIGKPHRINGFDFQVGAGQVIRGWDIGFANVSARTMAARATKSPYLPLHAHTRVTLTLPVPSSRSFPPSPSPVRR